MRPVGREGELLHPAALNGVVEHRAGYTVVSVKCLRLYSSVTWGLGLCGRAGCVCLGPGELELVD